jgi:UDP-N-acetyl-2-amino-2-deoxyglucuronate dehydrogenase
MSGEASSKVNGSGRVYGFGVVGCGVIGARHAQVARALPNAHFVAATDIIAERSKQLAADYGGEAEADLDSLLAREDVDVVAICTPNGLHSEVGVRAARAGKHLVVEKPIDITLAAADRLIGAAEAAGVKMTVISQHRFDAGLVELHRMLEAEQLGRLVMGDSRIKWYRTEAYFAAAPWRGDWAVGGGGALISQGIHYADLLLWCMGPVREVMAMCTTSAHDIEVEDVEVAALRFASGAIGSLEAATAVFPGFRERLEVSGTAGTVVVEDGRIVVRELLAEHGEVGPYGSRVAEAGAAGGAGGASASSGASDPAAITNDAHGAQVADLLAAIDEDRQPAVTGADGRNVLELVLAVYESARRNAPVTLPLQP